MSTVNDRKGHKEGLIWKCTGRMARWVQRYFTLEETKISYRYKENGPVKGTYDLTRGCVVREVVEEVQSGRMLYSFWILWPEVHEEDEANKCKASAEAAEGNRGSDDEVANKYGAQSDNEDRKTLSIPRDNDNDNLRDRDIKKIVEGEVKSARAQQQIAERSMEKLEAQDNNVSMGVKVAAVAVGGVVVGALTAGIGLVPYITVVGITAVASGGAVAITYRRPSDSRLVLACDSMAEALEWKQKVQHQVALLERSAREAQLPPEIDMSTILNTIGMTSSSSSGWVRTSTYEGMCILERYRKDDDGYAAVVKSGAGGSELSSPPSVPSASSPGEAVCRKAQLHFDSTPLSIFVALMGTSSTSRQPKRTRGCGRVDFSGVSSRVVQILDDHCDIVLASVRISSPCAPGDISSRSQKKDVQMLLSRFWKLDDDGTYIITYNSMSVDKLRGAGAERPVFDESSLTPDLNFRAVYVVSARRDIEDDEESHTGYVTCVAQVQLEKDKSPTSPSSSSSSQRSADEDALSQELLRVLLDGYLRQLPDVRDKLSRAKFYAESDQPSSPATENLVKRLFDAESEGTRASDVKHASDHDHQVQMTHTTTYQELPSFWMRESVIVERLAEGSTGYLIGSMANRGRKQLPLSTSVFVTLMVFLCLILILFVADVASVKD